jgi:hypothetical protein
MDNSVYWKGQDGNIWYKTSDGTRNMGTPSSSGTSQSPLQSGLRADGFDAQFGSGQGRMISDPNVGGGGVVQGLNTTTAPSIGSGGASTAPQFKDTTASRNATQTGLDSLGTISANRYANEDTSYGNLIKQYGDERATEQGKYNDQVGSNEKALASGQQAAMLAAAQGGRGLRSVLAAMGALGGTGAVLADRAVTDSANADLGGAKDNFDVNAKQLQTAWGDFDSLDKRRREQADNTRTTNKGSIDTDILTTRQGLLKDMAGFYEQAGNTGQYDNYMAQSTALTPQIAAGGRSTAAYTPVQGGFNPTELSSYLAGNRDMTVGRQAGAEGATALNSPLYASPTKKEKELV